MEELTGILVMVHPKLLEDHVHRQGQIGIITSADLINDEIFVGFGTRELGLYSANVLLVLKSHNEIYEGIMTHMKGMTTRDFKTLMEITLLQEKNSVSSLREALELAASNERVLKFSTVSLQDREYE